MWRMAGFSSFRAEGGGDSAPAVPASYAGTAVLAEHPILVLRVNVHQNSYAHALSARPIQKMDVQRVCVIQTALRGTEVYDGASHRAMKRSAANQVGRSSRLKTQLHAGGNSKLRQKKSVESAVAALTPRHERAALASHSTLYAACEFWGNRTSSSATGSNS